MANFTTPRTWSVGELVTKAMLDEQIRDNMNAIWVGTAAGDMDYYSAANAKTRLAKPSVVSLLQNSSAGTPSWLNKGNAYEILRTNSAANALEFAPVGAYCTVTHNTTQTIGSGATTIAWNTDIDDANAWHDPVTGNWAIAPHAAGVYISRAYIHTSGGASDRLKVQLRVSVGGVDTLIGAMRSGQTGAGVIENFVTVVSRRVTIAADDFFFVYADNNGGNTTMQADGWFELERVR